MKRIFFTKYLPLAFVILATSARAQITLTGTSYGENFNGLSSGLPSGWTVSTTATANTLGAAGVFANTATAWNSTTAGTDFRNISSDDLAFGANSAAQSSNTANRALGWRPLAAGVGAREGAATLTLTDTTGFTGFSLSVRIFTGNDVTNSQTYALEYRIGNSGNFTSITTYTTPSSGATGFNALTLTASSITLAALDDQSSTVYFRLRGTATTGTNLDTVGIDDFSLGYSAIPEPSTSVGLAGALVLAGAILKRGRWRRSS